MKTLKAFAGGPARLLTFTSVENDIRSIFLTFKLVNYAVVDS